MSVKTFDLSWPDHLSNLSDLFHNLYENNKLVDITLVCVEGSLKAHKIVLSICSPFFQKVLEENPCKHPVLILRGTSLVDMEHILDFMYTGRVTVSENEVTSLMQVADDLEVKGLRDSLEESCHPLIGDKKRKYPDSRNFYHRRRSIEDDWDNSNNVEETSASHGIGTRFKGKKRVNVSFDERIPKSAKLTKSQPDQPFKVTIKGIFIISIAYKFIIFFFRCFRSRRENYQFAVE